MSFVAFKKCFFINDLIFSFNIYKFKIFHHMFHLLKALKKKKKIYICHNILLEISLRGIHRLSLTITNNFFKCKIL